jgi:hypothetical protein
VRFHFHVDSSLVYPGWYVDDIAIHQLEPPPGVYLSPDTLEIVGCNGSSQNHTLNLVNWTGSDASVSLAYKLAEPALGTITGSTTISLSHGAGTSFGITLTPELCLPAGVALVGSMEASASGYVDSTIISQTIVTGGYWDSIADEPGDGRTDGVSAGYNGLVWSIAGHGDDESVHTYDPSTNSLATGPSQACSPVDPADLGVGLLPVGADMVGPAARDGAPTIVRFCTSRKILVSPSSGPIEVTSGMIGTGNWRASSIQLPKRKTKLPFYL